MTTQFLKALLGEMPVLTMFASQIAIRTGDAEPKMAGDEMVKRGLFNGSDVNNSRIAIHESI